MPSIQANLAPNDVVIVGAARTPVGSLNGTLKTLTAPQLGVIALKRAFETSGVNPEVVEEIYMGNVVQAGVGQSPARQVALGAGMKTSSSPMLRKIFDTSWRSTCTCISQLEILTV